MSQSKQFSKVPHWLLGCVASGAIPANAVVTYAAAAKYVNHRTGRGGWPRNRTLQADTGFSERTVRDHLRVLEEVGAIVREARYGECGRQTSSLLIVVTDEPSAPPGSLSQGGATGSQSPPPPGSQSPPIERDPLSKESDEASVSDVDAATTQEVTNPHSVGGAAAVSHSVTPTATVPVVLQRKLRDMGVIDGTAWTSAWQAATSVEWPEFAAFEAQHFPEEHLMLHLLQQQDRGQAISPSRWLRFFLEDRQRRITVIAGQIEQEARMSETPQEREDRLNRRLPPIWPDEPRPAATTGEKS